MLILDWIGSHGAAVSLPTVITVLT